MGTLPCIACLCNIYKTGITYILYYSFHYCIQNRLLEQTYAKKDIFNVKWHQHQQTKTFLLFTYRTHAQIMFCTWYSDKLMDKSDFYYPRTQIHINLDLYYVTRQTRGCTSKTHWIHIKYVGIVNSRTQNALSL